MTLNDIDHDLCISLLILAIRANWEAFPATVTETPEVEFSPLLMWLTLGDRE
jgi:hypothetical protein